MFKKVLKAKTLWIGVALVIATIALTAPLGEPLQAASETVAEPVLPPRGEGIGHGSYCDIPEHGAYFYGRDLVGLVTSDTGFARWCQHLGGKLGWSE